MKKFFDQYKKFIIPCSGIVLFMITGALAMFLTSNPAPKVIESSPKAQAQEVKATPQPLPEVQETPQKNQNEDWFVYVTGAVNKPGVYKLPDNPRVFHAIEAAGGFTQKADQTSINLAEKILMDGMHINIEEKGEREAREAKQTIQATARVNPPQPVNTNNNIQVPGLPASSRRTQTQSQSQSQNAGLVDVNHASEQELTRLKGVGPAIAKRIVDFRNNMGPFRSPEDLLQVRGIGPKTLEKMRPQILIR